MNIKKEPIVCYEDEKVILPSDLQQKIDKYWEEQIKTGRKYFNGEVFALDKIIKSDNDARIVVKKTDFAHFLYNRKVDENLGQYNINTVFASALVVTADDKILLGHMGCHTSRAGIIQFSGGGLELGDLGKNNIFDMKHSIIKELNEELGINIDDIKTIKSIEYWNTIKGEDGNIAVMYKIKLRKTADEFIQQYEQFTQQLKQNDIEPEFDRIVALGITKEEINNFIKNNQDRVAGYISKVLDKLV